MNFLNTRDSHDRIIDRLEQLLKEMEDEPLGQGLLIKEVLYLDVVTELKVRKEYELYVRYRGKLNTVINSKYPNQF